MSNNIFPKISIITVCYNAGKEIEETIKSVINQTYKNIEYIIIDGKSSDNTIEIVNNYADSIDLIISEKDNGIYDAMNKGIDYAHGEWLIFLNAADSLYSQTILEDIFKLKNYTEDIIFGDVMNEYKWGKVRIEGKHFTGVEKRMPFCHQSAFVRRSVLLKNKFDLNYRICADHNQFYNLYLNGYKFYHIPKIISNFNTNGVSGYSIKGYKEVSKINNYSFWTDKKGLLKAYFRVYLHNILPYSIVDLIRRLKYKIKTLDKSYL